MNSWIPLSSSPVAFLGHRRTCNGLLQKLHKFLQFCSLLFLQKRIQWIHFYWPVKAYNIGRNLRRKSRMEKHCVKKFSPFKGMLLMYNCLQQTSCWNMQFGGARDEFILAKIFCHEWAQYNWERSKERKDKRAPQALGSSRRETLGKEMLCSPFHLM